MEAAAKEAAEGALSALRVEKRRRRRWGPGVEVIVWECGEWTRLSRRKGSRRVAVPWAGAGAAGRVRGERERT